MRLGGAKKIERTWRSGALRVFICVWYVMVVQGSSAVAERVATTRVPQHFSFDIPAQSLDAALVAFSTVTGFELVYDSKLIGRSVSSDLRGDFSAEEAVRELLSGTGLHARKIAATTITIARNPNISPDMPRLRPEHDRHAAYFAAIQEGLNDAFCESGIVRLTGQRLMLRFRVSPAGRIAQLELVDLSKRGPPDSAVVDALSRLTFSQVPPADLPQPLMILINPVDTEYLRCAQRH